MTKAGAIYSFWSRFGLEAYESSSVPTGKDAPEFPYITYDAITGGWGDTIAASASLWYRENTWVNINAKTDEISNIISRGGVVVGFDDGAIWVKRGSPFAQSMGDPDDNMVKRKYINIEIEYISDN